MLSRTRACLQGVSVHVCTRHDCMTCAHLTHVVHVALCLRRDVMLRRHVFAVRVHAYCAVTVLHMYGPYDAPCEWCEAHGCGPPCMVHVCIMCAVPVAWSAPALCGCARVCAAMDCSFGVSVWSVSMCICYECAAHVYCVRVPSVYYKCVVQVVRVYFCRCVVGVVA